MSILSIFENRASSMVSGEHAEASSLCLPKRTKKVFIAFCNLIEAFLL